MPAAARLAADKVVGCSGEQWQNLRSDEGAEGAEGAEGSEPNGSRGFKALFPCPRYHQSWGMHCQARGLAVGLRVGRG